MFRMSRASLLARLPLYCSAECATPTNSSLFAIFSRNLANAPLPPESFALALFAQRTRIPTSARSIGFCAIWVCISSSSSSSSSIYRYNVKRGRSVFLAVLISPMTQGPSKEGASWHRFGTLALCERGEDDGKRFVKCLGLNCRA